MKRLLGTTVWFAVWLVLAFSLSALAQQVSSPGGASICVGPCGGLTYTDSTTTLNSANVATFNIVSPTNQNIFLNTNGGAVSTSQGFNVGGNLAMSGSGNINGRASAGTFFNSTAMYGWGSSGDNVGANDTALARNAVGVVEVNNGTACSTAANCRDLKLRHYGAGGTAPTANTCAGFALVSGGDSGAKITYTSATTCSINFGTAYTTAPACWVSPGTAASSVLVTTTTTVLSITFGTAQAALSFGCVGL